MLWRNPDGTEVTCLLHSPQSPLEGVHWLLQGMENTVQDTAQLFDLILPLFLWLVLWRSCMILGKGYHHQVWFSSEDTYQSFCITLSLLGLKQAALLSLKQRDLTIHLDWNYDLFNKNYTQAPLGENVKAQPLRDSFQICICLNRQKRPSFESWAEHKYTPSWEEKVIFPAQKRFISFTI